MVGVFATSFVSVAFAQEFPEMGIKVETVAENLEVPWEIDFATDGRIFFTERIGNLRVIENGLVSEPIISLEVSGTEEGGLLGLALTLVLKRIIICICIIVILILLIFTTEWFVIQNPKTNCLMKQSCLIGFREVNGMMVEE